MFHNMSMPGADFSFSPGSQDASQALSDGSAQVRAGADDECSAAFKIPKGTWFDEAVDFRDPEGDAVTREVLALIAAVDQRDRKRRQIDEANHYTIVRKILANGFRCHYHRRPDWVACLLRAGSYKSGPAWLSGKALSRSIRLLNDTGMLAASVGKPGTASLYRVTGRVCELAGRHGVGASSLTLRLPSKRLVRLRKSNSDGPLIDFEATEDTRRWAAQIDAYNAFLAQQDIGLAATADEEVEWMRHWNRDRRKDHPRLCSPELFRKDLYRQFNNGSFGEGGRMYGGWWINTPKALRKKITINGQQTVEADFSGCAIRMLYHERGIDYRDDPYWLEPLAAHEADAGLKTDHYREGVKALTQALINGDRDGRPEMARIEGFTFKPAFERPQVRRMIEVKHAAIADAFGTGAGLRLQRKDSDIALAVVTELKKQGIVSLPIHDSFLTTKENSDTLISQMKTSYKNIFDLNPIIR